MEPICRCHSCGAEVNAKNRRCPRCYVALRAATRAPAPLRATSSAATVDGQLALAPSNPPAEAVVDDVPAVALRCPACETTVLPVLGRCSYCHEPLGGAGPTGQPDEVSWALDNLSADQDDDAPMAQIIAGPWLRAGTGDDPGSGGTSNPARTVEEATTAAPTEPSAGDRATAEVGAGPLAAGTDVASDPPPEDASDPPPGAAEPSAPPLDADLAPADRPEPSAPPAEPHAASQPEAAVDRESNLATWHQRVCATLIDLSVFVPALVVTPLSLAVGGMLLLDALVFAVWQAWFLQGRSGQTLGKNRLGIKVISAKNRLPIGPKRSLKRLLAHFLDLALFAVGSRRPVRGANRQTVADRLTGTVVVRLR